MRVLKTDRTSRKPDVRTIGNVMEILRRRKYAVLLPAVAIFALAAALAFFLPRKFQSTTTILIEVQEVPREYVPANITTFADQHLQTINQRIMRPTMILELIGRFDLYADLKDRMPVDEIVAKMRKDIRFKRISADVIDASTGSPAQAFIAFSITYEGREPETVQKVASELASLYQGKFDELTRKSMNAKVAHGLEEEQLGERFSIIDAARMPKKPSSPNVLAILLIGLILGVGAGVGLAAVQESTDQTVRSAESLERATSFPVLSTIPVIVTEEDVAQRRGKRRFALVGAVFLLVACVFAFSLFVMDLDVLLGKVMRKFFS
jgi:uncharacterized protein involved in exopolysaccharide biosynthesis